MRPLFVLPAVLVPMAIAAAWATCRQLTTSARAVRAELAQLDTVLAELAAATQELDGARRGAAALSWRRAGSTSAHR